MGCWVPTEGFRSTCHPLVEGAFFQFVLLARVTSRPPFTVTPHHGCIVALMMVDGCPHGGVVGWRGTAHAPHTAIIAGKGKFQYANNAWQLKESRVLALFSWHLQCRLSFGLTSRTCAIFGGGG